MVEVVFERCAGIDIGKRTAKVCVRVQGQVQGGKRQQRSAEVRSWSSSMPQIIRLRSMLVAAGVQRVVMESTSDYWRPFFYVLARSWMWCWSGLVM